jgi:PAT family beta-lactamase induction signal transducer AmpG
MTDKQKKTTYRPHRRGAKTRCLWFPSLMFGDGLAVSVLVLTIVMLRRMGLDTPDTALAIALLCLPVLLRPLFEMIVTHFWGTTKVWILSTQFISALSLAAVAFTLHTSYWLLGTACFMPFFVCSALFYNIALHRFYIDTPIKKLRCCDGEMVTLHSSNLNTTTSNLNTSTPQHLNTSNLNTSNLNTSTSQHLNSQKSAGFLTMALLFGCGVMAMVGGNMEVVTRNIRYSWSFVFYVMAGMELFLWLWHTLFLPGGPHGYAKPKPTMGLHRGEFRETMRRMLQRKDDIATLMFLPLFLLPETLLALTAPLFVIAKPHNDGLGMSPQEFAYAQGTAAVIAITVGYILGIYAIRRHGLRRWLLPSALLLAVPGAALLFLSYNTAAPLSIVSAALAAGHAALGFALSMVKQVVVRFTRNMPDSTLRHAIARTFIATPFVIVGALASLMLTIADYQRIFQLATELAVVPLIVSVFYLYLTHRQPQAE